MSDRQPRHPDIYTPAEAAAFLGVEVPQLEILEKDYGLVQHRVGRAKVYGRQNLEDTGLRMIGIRPAQRLQPVQLKIGGR